MIANISRIAQFQECRKKAENWHIRGLMSHREADALMTGEATHVGIAEIAAQKSVEDAVKLAESTFRKRLEGQLILPEELPEIERQIEISKRAIAIFADRYSKAEFRILWPEVEFRVALPGTEHHCYFFHKILHDEESSERELRCGCLHHNPCQDPRCIQPIYFQGRTDGVIEMEKKVWLLETKTTAMTGNIFYDRFFLDFQPTGYLYGIWKTTGVRPCGFMLNVIKKPNRRAANQFDLGFEREAYLRDDEDLVEFEREFIQQAEDYEDAVVRGRMYRNTKSCTSFNRRCYYWERCKRHDEELEGEFRHRNPDYIDAAYYEVLGLPVPEPPDESPAVELARGDL